VNDTATTPINTAVTTSVLTNDTLGVTPTTITSNTDGVHGTVSCTTTQCTFTPTTGYTGTDSYTYTITDNNGKTSTATVNVTIDPLPVAVNDTATTPINTAVTTSVLTNDTLGVTPTTITSNTDGAHGTVSCTTTQCTFTPTTGYTGTDSYTYTITDNNGKTSTATVNVTIDALPDAVNDSATTDQDSPVTIDVTGNDDFGGDGPSTGTITLPTGGNGLDQPDHGSLQLVDGSDTDPSNDRITYLPASGYYGTDTFEYQICDSNGDCDVATVTIAVEGDPRDLVKRIIDTNQVFTTGSDVAIGEIVTYEVSIVIKPGTIDNAKLVDEMDLGLAFVDCVNINATGLTPNDFSSICLGTPGPTVETVTPYPFGTAEEDNMGRRVIFDFGTLTNAGPVDVTLRIQYRAVVLDIASNKDGENRNNKATWYWENRSVGPASETVHIVEPIFAVTKSANVTTVAEGTPVTFTLTVQPTNQSHVTALDVELKDALPAELSYLTGPTCTAPSVTVTLCTYDDLTNTISVGWDSYPVDGGVTTVTFDALVNTVPAYPDVIENKGILTWTSLPGDVLPGPYAAASQNGNTVVDLLIAGKLSKPVPVPGWRPKFAAQSQWNTYSHERYYNPGSGVDTYGVQAAVVLSSVAIPGNATPNEPTSLPSTGFAPNMVTILPDQTAEQAYVDLGDLWLEVPSLRIKTPIVGVPKNAGDWNVDWLWEQAGWLQGTAFPTWQGNSVLTGHVYLPSGLPGPFVDLSKLRWGNQIIVHAFGQRHIYEVRTNRIILPTDLSALKHEEDAWLTLITCRSYDESSGAYRYRIVTRAVLLKVEAER
jgi:LPXTG-site transpeptidase (sortase) family protein